MKKNTAVLLGLILLLVSDGFLRADTLAPDKVVERKAANDGYSVEDWWHGDRLTGDWLGARTDLEEHGVTFLPVPRATGRATLAAARAGGLPM